MSRSKPPRYKRFNVLNKPVVAVRIIGLGLFPSRHHLLRLFASPGLVFAGEIRGWVTMSLYPGIQSRMELAACKKMKV